MQMFMDRPIEEVADMIELFDKMKMPNDAALRGLKVVRDEPNCLSNQQITKNLNAGMILIAELLLENEKLRREREDLRMFAKGVANNITEMLK